MSAQKDSKSREVPQEILDELTRVRMPANNTSSPDAEVMNLNGLLVSNYQCNTLVLGSGAAGLRTAVELKRRQVDVLVASTGLFSGTSACSGSDKQTLHTAGTDYHGDDFIKCAKSLAGGGSMDEDMAYIESTGSLDALVGLKYLGLPLPMDKYGCVLRYQTDHDDVGRATSCGPRTSRLMVKVLFKEAVRLGVPFISACEGIKILKNDKDQVSGMLALHRNDEYNRLGLIVINCQHIVLANGGPGELFRDSVYPKHCYGALGLALEAGIDLCNVCEHQFGIGTPREHFPWNLSGTYVQAMPRIYSIDEKGNQINFLSQYYRTTRECVSNIFRKGYQWPFHAARLSEYGSSLFDLAVFLERQKGHRVYMDFSRNPESCGESEEFSLENIDADVRSYLENNDALLQRPIDRLKSMNPLAIELYRMHGTDLHEQPLEFAVNHQHMNGGVDVNIWGESSVKGCYAVGEAAGTHGVTRPGGAALNAGQVLAIRCATHISKQQEVDVLFTRDQKNQISDFYLNLEMELSLQTGLDAKKVKENVQDLMSEHASFLVCKDDLDLALQKIKDVRYDIQKDGIKVSSKAYVADLIRVRHLSLAAEAILKTLQEYVMTGGGSRGARAIYGRDGSEKIDAKNTDLSLYQLIPEKLKDREEKLMTTFNGEEILVSRRPVKKLEEPIRSFFEKSWPDFLTGKVYKER